MENSQENQSVKKYGKWTELNIQTERVSETTKERYVVKGKMLLLWEDIKRIGSHPNYEDKSLMMTVDGLNYIVDTPYEMLKKAMTDV